MTVPPNAPAWQKDWHLQVIEDLARAVALPGSTAILLAADNTADGHAPIAEAVRLERAFTVNLAPHVIGIDLDDPTQGEALNRFAESVSAHGISPVIVASGRRGHRHLFAAVHDGTKRRLLFDEARHLRLPIAWSLRPPLSPHRSGLDVRLVQPDDPTDALRALQPSPRRALSAHLALLLRNGDVDHRYSKQDGETDRSRMLAALVTGYINRGWAFEDAYRQLAKPTNHGGAKLHELRRHDEQPARRYLRGVWTHQVAFVRRRPPDGQPSHELTRRLDVVVAQAALTLPWRIRGHSTWALLVALALRALEAGDLTAFEASTRRLAEGAGLSWRTTKKRLRDLLDEERVILVRRGIGKRGSIWRLVEPPTAATVVPSNPGGLAPPGGVLGLLGSLMVVGHDGLRWRAAGRTGLGKAIHRLLVVLSIRPSRRPNDLARDLCVSHRSLRRLLMRLQREGFTGPDNVPCGATEFLRLIGAAAWRRRTAGAGERQKRRHAGEREEYLGGYRRRLSIHLSARRSDPGRAR